MVYGGFDPLDMRLCATGDLQSLSNVIFKGGNGEPMVCILVWDLRMRNQVS
jgi:hypothetical protein